MNSFLSALFEVKCFENRLNKHALLFSIQSNADCHSYRKVTNMNNIAFCNCAAILHFFFCARRN